jgi:hypothetical protein
MTVDEASTFGWSSVIVICVMLAFNLFTMLTIQVLDALRKFKLWRLKRKQQG